MLELRHIVPHIGGLAQETSRRAQERDEQLALALIQARLAPDEWAKHAHRVTHAITRQLRAIPVRPDLPPALDLAHPDAPPLRYTALATDGSQIPLDRHEIAPFTLLNIGLIAIHYGTGERPTLAAKPTLLYRDEDLFPSNEEMSADDENGDAGGPYISERDLATRRMLMEMESLGTLIETWAGRPETIAFVDGTLILWSQEAEPSQKRQKVIDAFVSVLERAKDARVPVVGYLSRPANREVITTLRVTLCPDDPVNCKSYTSEEEAQMPCAVLGRLTDSELFSRLLIAGQRSGLYRSRSRVLNSYPRDQRTIFCYLNTGSEIARLEIPDWVASDEALLKRVHTLTLDQVRKGNGYPVSLSEAHEQAIVRGPERAAVFHLVERALSAADLPALKTSKLVAKRRRSV